MRSDSPLTPAPLALRPRGPIPCVRVGCCVLYPYHLLQAWLAEQAAKGGEQ